MSSGWPIRPAGIALTAASPIGPSSIGAASSVRIKPGQIAFAVTAGARSRISPSIPALAAAYDVLLRAGNAPPVLAFIDEMQTIRPQPAASIDGATQWLQLKEPFRWTLITRSQSASVSSVNGFGALTP